MAQSTRAADNLLGDFIAALESIVTALVDERLHAEPQRRFLSKSALAAYLGVQERTVKTWREHGLPARKVGKTLMFDLEEVERWIDHEGSA